MLTLLILGGLFYTFFNLTGGGSTSSPPRCQPETKIISHTRLKKGDDQ